jgi:diguanylate cyclase (GGDEF)-like protein
MIDESPIILAVDDKVDNLDILAELLSEYDVRDVKDARSALKILEQTPVDLILLDIMMPDIDGFELCRMIQENEHTRAIPIIFISAMTDEKAIEQAFEAGCKDYVTKPFRPRELLARVKTQLDLKFLMERLHFLAFHDSLTGIFNRRRFFELAKTLFDERGDLHAVLLDIDHFKKVNDAHGHAVGDEVLRQVTGTIAERLPPEAIFGRLGGEEFAVLVAGQHSEVLIRDLESIRRAVAALSIPADSGMVRCTISCGIFAREPTTSRIDELLHNADLALYQAKESGRDRVVLKSTQNRQPVS